MLQTTLAVLACVALFPQSEAKEVALVKKGKANVVILSPLEKEAPKDEAKEYPAHARLRAAIADLALYLEKMSGARIGTQYGAPAVETKGIPILIGSLGAKRFGPPSVKSPFKQALRVVVSKKAIACIGESDEATSDAIYEVLHRLGCRWYLPGDWGEEVPRMDTITMPEMDLSKAPPTIYRNIWYADNDYKRRNRLGGIYYWAAHSLEGYISPQQRKDHPDWNAEFDGKRPITKGGRICWGNPEVADAVADSVIKRLDAGYKPCMSLSPGDGMTFCQCAKCRSFDAGDWDPGMQQASMTDRYIQFCNRVARRVTAKYPDVIFGILAYQQYTRAPVREKLHPSLVPLIAPIMYCRAHSMANPDCPSRQRLRTIVEGWGKTGKNLAIDDYAFNLAEVSCPFPLISKWGRDLPIYYANHMNLWKPETMPTFEASLPGLYLGVRMSWYPESKPKDILDEFFTRFYGAAERPMRDYWMGIDAAWANSPQHAGCRFGHPARFTPEVMGAARAAVDEALVACKTITEYKRVKLVDHSLMQFELYMKMLHDFHTGRWGRLDVDADLWIGGWDFLRTEYQKQHAFTHYGTKYFKRLSGFSYRDAARVAREFKVLMRPIRAWSFIVDKDEKGEELGWQKPDLDEKGWRTTDPCVETWSSMGLYEYFGAAWYRAKVKVTAVPEGKKVYLWIGAADSACKLFLNGRHVPYVDKKGEAAEQFAGYAYPGSFDISAAVKTGAENQLAIRTYRSGGWINEVGTGGLLGPVTIYQER